LTFSKKMNKVPVSPAWRGTLDFVSVERAAAEILDEVKNDSANGDGLVKYVYESGDVEIAIQDMQTSLEQQKGERFEGVSVDEWTTAAVAEGLDQLVATYLDSASEMPLVFPKLLRADRKRRVSSETKGQENAGQPDTWALGLRGFLGRWSFRG
jgi:hybrid polyketide synthase/nonribosomal peptide synthetase ACE1